MRRNAFTRAIALVLLTQIIASPVFAQKEGDTYVYDEQKAFTNEDSNVEPPINESDNNEQLAPENAEPETDTEGKLDSPFDVTISIGSQSAWNKKVPLIVSITPRIDATRTQITWDTRYGLDFVQNVPEFFPMAKGVTQEYKAYVIPEEPGSYSISVNVTDWGYGRNYTSSDAVNIKFGEDLVTIPATDGYQQSVILRYVVITFGVVIFLVVMILLGKYGIVWLKEWLKPPQ